MAWVLLKNKGNKNNMITKILLEIIYHLIYLLNEIEKEGKKRNIYIQLDKDFLSNLFLLGVYSILNV